METLTTPQKPIGSGFGPRNTADDVLRGIDLSGHLAIVTGGYSGVGLETTRALARAGARVVVPARRPAAAREALRGVDGVEVDDLDLADLDSVRSFTDRFRASGRDIDIVITSAGIMACPETRVGPGWEAQFAVNHLAHHALVNLLWPVIARGGPARVVAVSSGANPQLQIRWDDVHFAQDYDKWQAYGQSKAANVLFAAHLDALGRDAGVRAFSVHPGSILSPLQRHLSRAEMVAAGWIDEHGELLDPTFKTPAQGAATQVWAATSPQLVGMGGVHCADCDIAEMTDPGKAAGGTLTRAARAEQAARLWALSADLTGIDAFAPTG